MAQEAVEVGVGGQQDSEEGEGGRWLFTLHSDQSFLSTPELRDSRIDTHPVEGKKTDRRITNCIRTPPQEFNDMRDYNFQTISTCRKFRNLLRQRMS